MKAVHLAAGEGTRLRPITNKKPKPLVELGGRSLLERNISTLTTAGVKDHVVVTGHRSADIKRLGYETVHNVAYEETDMVYSLFCAAPAFPDSEDLVISYGDIIYAQRVAEALLECEAQLCVVVDREWRQLWELRFDDPLEDAETLKLGTDNRILSIGESPDSYDEIDAQYVGLLKVRSDCISQFVSSYQKLASNVEGYLSIDTTTFIQRLIDEGWQVQGVPVNGGWLEVDTLEDLETYRSLLEMDNMNRVHGSFSPFK